MSGSTRYSPEQAQQVAQQFDQLVQNGQITGKARIRVLTRAINNLATALGSSVPTSTVPPGPPGREWTRQRQLALQA